MTCPTDDSSTAVVSKRLPPHAVETTIENTTGCVKKHPSLRRSASTAGINVYVKHTHMSVIPHHTWSPPAGRLQNTLGQHAGPYMRQQQEMGFVFRSPAALLVTWASPTPSSPTSIRADICPPTPPFSHISSPPRLRLECLRLQHFYCFSTEVFTHEEAFRPTSSISRLPTSTTP